MSMEPPVMAMYVEAICGCIIPSSYPPQVPSWWRRSALPQPRLLDIGQSNLPTARCPQWSNQETLLEEGSDGVF